MISRIDGQLELVVDKIAFIAWIKSHLEDESTFFTRRSVRYCPVARFVAETENINCIASNESVVMFHEDIMEKIYYSSESSWAQDFIVKYDNDESLASLITTLGNEAGAVA